MFLLRLLGRHLLPLAMTLTTLMTMQSAWTLAAFRYASWQKGSCGNVIIPSNSSTNQSVARSIMDCAAACMPSTACNAVSYWSSSKLCQQTSFYVTKACGNYTVGSGSEYREKRCLNGGVENSTGGCSCCCGFLGARCERAMEDCLEGVPYDYTGGLYWVQPRLAPAPFLLTCGTGGGNHAMRRASGTVNFTRPWADYRTGFGSTEIWTGLPNLHYMTYSKLYKLAFVYTLKNGTRYYSAYLDARIENEADGFRFHFQSAQSVTPPNYYMDHCLAALNNTRFSAFDLDNDGDPGRNCAQDYQSGFWFNSSACALCNPTGPLLHPADMLPTNVPAEAFWRSQGLDLIPQSVVMYLI